jgi:hypothetical protein
VASRELCHFSSFFLWPYSAESGKAAVAQKSPLCIIVCTWVEGAPSPKRGCLCPGSWQVALGCPAWQEYCFPGNLGHASWPMNNVTEEPWAPGGPEGSLATAMFAYPGSGGPQVGGSLTTCHSGRMGHCLHDSSGGPLGACAWLLCKLVLQ